ncbi:hypothetical protein [Bradyrhizobium sp.]|uniref:hypothetical protein n=4 Tax=Pseudomonadota TaxID=1224 RepID=UPI003918BCCB
MGELMRIERMSGGFDRKGQFVSAKCGRAIPVRHHLMRDALVQASLDPTVRSIEYLSEDQIATALTKIDAVVIQRDDGRYHLDVVEARPRRSTAQRLLVAQSLLDLGLRPLVRTESEILNEPGCTNARMVWKHADHSVEIGLRLQILGALTDEGAMPLADLLKSLRTDRDPVPSVMALACIDLIALDLVSAPLGPRTLTRLRE